VLGCSNSTTAITIGQTVNGSLSTTDCVNPVDSSLYDAYSFNGTTGQQIVISMNSTQFDTYLYLMLPGETTLRPLSDPNPTIQDDDGGGGTNARITQTLPSNGTYTILANAFWAPNNPQRTDNGQGAYTLTLSNGAPCTNPVTPITPNTTVNGTLSTTDCNDLGDNTFYDVYSFSGTAGQQVSITMTASFDTYLFLVAPDGDDLAEDDNGGGGTNSRIPANTTDLARLPQTGTYHILANSGLNTAGTTGSYQLTLTVGGTNCPSTAITFGQTANGALAPGDCRLPADSSFIDVYTFTGTAGQGISVAMNSGTFDTFLFLLSPGGSVLAQDDNGGGGTNARIPAGTGNFTLPSTGTYTIYANSATPNLTGAYTLTLTGTQVCTYTLNAPSRAVSAGGGTFTDAFTTQAGCAAPTVTSNSTAFITAGTPTVNSSGQGSFTYTVNANTTTAARSGTLTVGGQTFTVNEDAACSVEIFPGAEPFTQAGGAGSFTVFPSAQCTWTVSTATPWLHITAPAAGTGSGKARVRFTVDANSGSTTRTGTITVGTSTFNVTETSAATTPQIQFSSASYSVSENDANKFVSITVARSGDTTGVSTVEYSTVDSSAQIPCDPTLRDGNGNLFPSGIALARCDYVTTIDTLTFNAGETVKTFTIPIINDVHVEGAETFQIALANPQGATLGTQANATVTINDDDTTLSSTNPIRQSAFFVRQQYLDFLSREPDTAGFNTWTTLFSGCANQDNTDGSSASAPCDRISISASFFLSDEFRLKGFFVFLYWKTSFGTQSNPNYVPEYEEIVPDMRRVTGATANETLAKRDDFAENWVNRIAFKNRYDALTNAQFVDTLLSNVGATLTNADPNSGQTRDSLVAALNGGTKTRAEVLRIIVESQEVNTVQFNPAFVAMQYYGYLRRKPEPQGYQDWLNVIGPQGQSPRVMINGFVNSPEYYLRFGPNVRQ
jgi:hypothetical protein